MKIGGIAGIEMDEVIINWLRSHQEYALIIVPAIAFVEACLGIGLFVSGIILLTVCTILYTENIATLAQMLPLAFLGATTADHSGYYLGRWIGPRFHHTKFAIKQKKTLDKAESLIVKFGEFAIIFGRLMTAIRSLVPLLTGVSGLSRLKYSLYDLLACAIWTAGLGLLIVGFDKLFT
ncbi:MAG: membrane-associated protein [Candidatus Azotimanducaceae bacterium]|jgi:membrane-associated protein